jgi:S-methylmethionine-dependent homocysteine/selenocysteine methylase
MYSFTLDRKDFETDREYDDYLETNADIIYSMTYGSRAEAAAARTRLADFQRANRAAIDKSKSRRFQERADQERKERQAAGGSVQTMTAPIASVDTAAHNRAWRAAVVAFQCSSISFV